MKPHEVAEISAYATLFNQRFGQLIDNAVGIFMPGADLFYISDAELLECVRSYARRYQREVDDHGIEISEGR